MPFQINDLGSLQYMYIRFNGDRADELFTRFGISKFNCVFEGFEHLKPLWKQSLLRAGKENIDLFGESMLLYAFSSLQDTISPNNNIINQMLKVTEEEFSNPAFTLNSLSVRLGYNPNYISHLFKKKVGVSFSEYLTNIRLKHSLFLMNQGVTSIKNLALLSGYSDPLYFSKTFKKYIGTSPRDFLSSTTEN